MLFSRKVGRLVLVAIMATDSQVPVAAPVQGGGPATMDQHALRPDQYAQPVLALIALRQMEAKFEPVHAELAPHSRGV